MEEGSSNIIPELKNGKERNWVTIILAPWLPEEKKCMLECLNAFI
jgi:hypothetical protein